MEKQYICESKSSHPVLATNIRAESRKRIKEMSGRRSLGFYRNSLEINTQTAQQKKSLTRDGNVKSQKHNSD